MCRVLEVLGVIFTFIGIFWVAFAFIVAGWLLAGMFM